MTANLLTALQTCGLTVQSDCGLISTRGKPLQSWEEAQTWLGDLLMKDPTATGWAQFSDANVLIQNGNLRETPTGVLLAAELHLSGAGKDESHHLRFDGSTWITSVITLNEKEEGSVLERCSFVRSDDRGRTKIKLHYEVSWKPEPDVITGALRPYVFRIVRNSQKQDNE